MKNALHSLYLISMLISCGTREHGNIKTLSGEKVITLNAYCRAEIARNWMNSMSLLVIKHFTMSGCNEFAKFPSTNREFSLRSHD